MSEQLDIVALIEKNPITKLSKDYNVKLLVKVKENFKYDSLNNDQFLTTKDLKRIIKSC